MDNKIQIKVYRKESIEELSSDFVSENSRLDTGSLSASTAAFASALLERVAGFIIKDGITNDRIEYILKNSGIVRNYMVYLIDEDVKCKSPLRKALKEGGEQEIEACRHPACAICNEIVNMMSQLLDLAYELKAFCPRNKEHYLKECAEMALSSVKTAMSFILDEATYLSDETMRFVIIRENEITLSKCEELYRSIVE